MLTRSTSADGRDVAYVFSDLNILHSDSDTWMKYAPDNSTRETKNPAVRFQHSAVITGSLFAVYGGRFQTTDDSRTLNGLNLTLIEKYDLEVRLRRRVLGTSTSSTDTFILRQVTAANSDEFSNAVNTTSDATRYARRSPRS